MLRFLILLVLPLSLTCLCRPVGVRNRALDALTVGTPETVFATPTRAREPDGTYGIRRSQGLAAAFLK